MLSSIHSGPFTVCTAYSESQSSTVPASMPTGLLLTTTSGKLIVCSFVYKIVCFTAAMHDTERLV
jgi:hypothetical protein